MPMMKRRKKFDGAAALSSLADLLIFVALAKTAAHIKKKDGQPASEGKRVRTIPNAAVRVPFENNVRELFEQARADLPLDKEERDAARSTPRRVAMVRVEIGDAAERLLVEALAAVADSRVCALLGDVNPVEELVCALERLPEMCGPLWGCFYGRQPFGELVVSLLPGTPVDRMLALLVWRGAREVNELAWRRAIGELSLRARWMVSGSRLEVAV